MQNLLSVARHALPILRRQAIHVIVLIVALACSDSGITTPARPSAASGSTNEVVGAAVASGGPEATAGGTLTNGGNHAGNITVAGQTDSWTFSATQGELLVIAIGETTGSADFTPWIRLNAPNGSTIGNTWNAAAAQIEVAAPQTGTYTVLAATADAGNDGTGTYNLTLAQIPGTPTVPGGDHGGPTTNGALHTGALFVGDLDQWTFTASLGDYLAVSVGEVSGTTDFTPWIRLVAPNGAIIGNAWNAAAAQVGVAATMNGTYTVIVSTADAGNDATGTYQLSLVRSSGSLTTTPGDQGGGLTNGAIHTGTLTVGDLDGWSISATQGELLTVAVGEISGTTDFTPWVRLIAPNGAVLGNAWNAAAAQVSVNATITGTYTVIVSTADAGNDGAGDYRLNISRAPGTPTVSPGDEGGPATNGALHIGNIDIGDLDIYTFTSNAGLPMAISIGEVSGTTDFTPWIRLVAPDGTLIASAWNAAAAQISLLGTGSGTYTVLVSTADAGNDATGSYRLNIHKAGNFTVSPGDQGGTIANGANQSGTILTGDLDRYTFTANQGEYVAISVGEVTGSADFTPWLRVADPTGLLLGNSWNAAAAQVSFAAPVTGTYTVVIGTADAGNDGTGDFQLTVVKGPGAFIVPVGDHGGPLSNGNVGGSIHVGDLDPWSFTANQGSAISLVLTELSGTAEYTPWIRLVGPTGTLYGNQWGASSATININAPLTGTYTIIVGTADSGNDATGTYNLSVSGVNSVPGTAKVVAGNDRSMSRPGQVSPEH